jgi:hypothetical protein
VGSIDVTIASIIFFKIVRILFLWIILVIIDFWLQLRLVVGVLFVFIVRKEFEDTKGAIRIRILKKDRQYNGQEKKYKRTNSDLQNTTFTSHS